MFFLAQRRLPRWRRDAGQKPPEPEGSLFGKPLLGFHLFSSEGSSPSSAWSPCGLPATSGECPSPRWPMCNPVKDTCPFGCSDPTSTRACIFRGNQPFGLIIIWRLGANLIWECLQSIGQPLWVIHLASLESTPNTSFARARPTRRQSLRGIYTRQES